MTVDELRETVQVSIMAVLSATALWKTLEADPGTAVAAEVVGQALDALVDVTEALMDRLEALT